MTDFKTFRTCLLFSACSVLCGVAFAQNDQAAPADIQVPLLVNSGVPIRVYIVNRLRMRKEEPVTAKVIEPIYASDRIVIPVGAELQGHITGFDPAPKMVRARAILGGDFTPLHSARVAFTSLTLADGATRSIHTSDSEGLMSIYAPARRSANGSTNNAQTTGILGTAKHQIQEEISTRTQRLVDLVRGPNKKELLEDYLIKKLPYHPQWYRRNTRFDAVLSEPIDYGNAGVPGDALRMLGLPSPDSVAQVRLTTPVNSADSDTNTKVEGILSQPIFSATHELILPEGTRLSGRVRHVQAARWFHRGGQLRFTFDLLEPPAWTRMTPVSAQRKEVQLAKAESDPRAHVKIDAEGEAKATESKLRLLGPVLALIVARRAMEEEGGRERGGTGGANGNYTGRTAAGFSGFGLLGSAAARASQTAGTALGFYGLGWTIYSTVISKGRDVEFPKNSAIEVRFGAHEIPGQKKQRRGGQKTPAL